MVRANMRLLCKTALVCLLAVILSFCVFGFLATFEPNPPSTQWTWRLIYGSTALLSALGSIRLWKVAHRK